MFTNSLPGLIFISPVVVIVDPLIANVSTITDPVPAVLNSKLLFDIVVVIKLSSISISPVLNVSAVISPELSTSETIIDPLTLKLFVISTSFSGMNILPVPLARNSKSALESVVVILFPLNSISSNCITLALIITSPVTSKLPVRLISPI